MSVLFILEMFPTCPLFLVILIVILSTHATVLYSKAAGQSVLLLICPICVFVVCFCYYKGDPVYPCRGCQWWVDRAEWKPRGSSRGKRPLRARRLRHWPVQGTVCLFDRSHLFSWFKLIVGCGVTSAR